MVYWQEIYVLLVSACVNFSHGELLFAIIFTALNTLRTVFSMYEFWSKTEC